MQRRSRWQLVIAGLVVVSTLLPVSPVSRFVQRFARATMDVDVTSYGANGADTDPDTAAINAANDAVHLAGGGRVFFPAGTYRASNIKQYSNVEFYGADRTTTVIQHVDPTGNSPLLTSRTYATTGQIQTNYSTLTVASAANIVQGSIIGIRAAGGPAPDQATTLSVPILPGTKTLYVAASAKDFSPYGGWLFVDNEIVEYGEYDAVQHKFTNVVRGKYGTAAMSHLTGATVSNALRLVARVAQPPSGNVITLDRPAVFGVSAGTPVTVGSTGLTVRSLTLDGNQQPGATGLAPWPAYYQFVGGLHIVDCIIKNGENGGIRLEPGWDSLIEDTTFKDNGDGVGHGGAPSPAHLWVFHNSDGNTVQNNVFEGPIRWAVAIDDRTTNSTELDGSSDGNTIIGNDISFPRDDAYGKEGIAVFGSDGNTITFNTVTEILGPGESVDPYNIGIEVGNYPQGTAPLDSNGNNVSHNTLGSLKVGIRTNGAGNTFASNIFTSVDVDCDKVNEPDQNAFTGNGAECDDA